MLGVEFGEATAVVNGFSHYKHRSEGKMIIVNDLSKIF